MSFFLSKAKTDYINSMDRLKVASSRSPSERISDAEFRRLRGRYEELCRRGEIPVD